MAMAKTPSVKASSRPIFDELSFVILNFIFSCSSG
jgi:hypothetical protein